MKVDLSPYVGGYPRLGTPETYWVRGLGGGLELLLVQDEAFSEARSLGRLSFLAPDRARLETGIGRVDHTFLRDAGGEVAFLRVFGRVLLQKHREVPAALQGAAVLAGRAQE